MSRDLNQVQIIGRLGKDPETRYTQDGRAITSFAVAAGRQWRTTEGDQREDTEWFNVVAWEKLGEICAQYLEKGSRIYIEGRLQTRSWDDQATGQKHYRTEVIASDMIMLGGRNDTRGNGEDGEMGLGEPDADMESGGRSYGQRAEASRPMNNQRPATNGNGNAAGTRPAPQRAPQPTTQPRRAAPQPTVDEDDLPF